MINTEDIKKWKNEGFILKKNFIKKKRINFNFLDQIKQKLNNINDFGSNGIYEFPTFSFLDKLTLDENIINSIKLLLDTENILLIQADTWIKKGSNNFDNLSNNDQRMHMDYGNNMITHCSPWNSPEAVSIIIYLSDTKETAGGTCIVPRIDNNDELYQMPYIKMPGINNFKFINDKLKAESYFLKKYPDIFKFRQKLYEREIKLEPNIGDVLFYRLDIWHRGTPVKINKKRIVMNIIYKKRECYWINNWNSGFTKQMYNGKLEKLICNLSVNQRSTLGFPKPTDNYWKNNNIKFITKRYPDFPIIPYISKL